MGRRKIAIEPITEERNRTVTFVKRKAGLFKKAHELSILCQVDVLVIIVGHNHKVYEFSSADTDDLLTRYKTAPRLQESKQPKDYGFYDKKSRISEHPGKKKSKKLLQKELDDLKRQASYEPEGDEDDEDDEDLIALELGEDDDEDEEEEEDDDDLSKDDEKPRLRGSSLKRQQQSQQTPSKPSKLRNTSKNRKLKKDLGTPLMKPFDHNIARQSAFRSQSMDQSRIQSTFQHQRILLQQQQQLSSPLPPLSNFQSSPHLKTYGPQQGQNQTQQQQQLAQYAPSPAYSSTSSNGGRNSGQSQRPVLRVQIPSTTNTNEAQNEDEDEDEDAVNDQDNRQKKNDSAMTITAIESSKDEKQSTMGTNIKNGQLAPPKPILPGLGIASNGNTSQQNNQNSNSSKSTPISATAPNGMFILPQPQPSPSGSHTNNIFPSPFNGAGGNNAVGYYNSQNTSNPNLNTRQFTGETPLSALPSKYLNNDLLFLSPSNFYSNEWNIPFGASSGNGSTPITANRNQANLAAVLASNNLYNNNNPANNNNSNMVIENGGTLSAIIRDNTSIMLPSPSQMVGNVFGNTVGNNGGSGNNSNTSNRKNSKDSL